MEVLAPTVLIPRTGFATSDLTLATSLGEFVEPLRRAAPGTWTFAVAAPPGTGGRRLELAARLRDRTIATESAVIAVDRSAARGAIAARGGCSTGQSGPSPAAALALAAVGLLWRRRRY